MKESITVNRADLEGARRLFGLLQSAPPAVAAQARSLSHTPRRGQVYAHRALAAKLNPALRFAQPDLADVHIDVPLTNISVSYRNPLYIGGLVFPRVPVVKESGLYFIFNRAEWLRDEAKMRAIGGTLPRGGWTQSTGNYSVNEWGFETPVDDRIRDNADNPLSPDRTATEFSTDKVDLRLEKIVRDLVFTAGNWSNSLDLSSGGNYQLSDYSNSDPMGIFYAAQQAVLLGCGFLPNTLVLGYQVFIKLAQHPDLLDRIKYTGTGEKPAMVTAAMLAELFQVDQVLIGQTLYDTANEGATSSPSFLWDKQMWLGYVASAPAIETPSAGYTFSTGRIADRYREEKIVSDVSRVREKFDCRATAAGAGYLWQNAVA